MLNKFEGTVSGVCKFFDDIAGWGIVAVMFLTVSNIILRLFIKNSILGTYEYIGFCTAAAIGFALAYCALRDGHLAVSFVLERFSPKIQVTVDIITGLIAFSFLCLSAWHLGKYAYSMVVSGEVSPTARLPFYPFIYFVAAGVFMLALVLMIRVVNLVRRGGGE